MKSSLLSAKKCRAMIVLRSRMHCLSPSDKPNNGSEAGRNGTPPWLLLTNECRKLDNTCCGGPRLGKRQSSSYEHTTKFEKLVPHASYILFSSHIFAITIHINLLILTNYPTIKGKHQVGNVKCHRNKFNPFLKCAFYLDGRRYGYLSCPLKSWSTINELV